MIRRIDRAGGAARRARGRPRRPPPPSPATTASWSSSAPQASRWTSSRSRRTAATPNGCSAVRLRRQGGMVPRRSPHRLRAQREGPHPGGDLDGQRPGRRSASPYELGQISAAPTWTAEGRIVYFTTKDFAPPGSPEEPPPPSELYSMAADGSDQRRLTNEAVMKTDPAVSPTDGTVAYVAFRPVSQGARRLRSGVVRRSPPTAAASGRWRRSRPNEMCSTRAGPRTAVASSSSLADRREAPSPVRSRRDELRWNRASPPHSDPRARDQPGVVTRRSQDRLHE